MISRRRFLKSATTGLVTGELSAQKGGIPAGSGSPGRILLKGGIEFRLDNKVGDFEKADVLIECK